MSELSDQADQLITLVGDLGHKLEASNAAAAESNRRINGIVAVVKQAVDFGRHNRRLIRLGMLSIALDVGLSVVLGFTVNRADDATHLARVLAESNQKNLVANCVGGNVTRKQQLGALETLLNVPVRTAAGRAVLAKDLAAVEKAYAPKNCSGE